MATLVALYTKPVDPAAFDDYYFDACAAGQKIAGLRRYEISVGAVNGAQSDSPYHLVAMPAFYSMEAIQQALQSPEGKASAGDLGNFAQAGVELLSFDAKQI